MKIGYALQHVIYCVMDQQMTIEDRKEKNQEVVKNQGGLGRLAPTCNKDAHLLRKRLGTSVAAHHYLTHNLYTFFYLCLPSLFSLPPNPFSLIS